jgi:hypothetical protein
MEYEPCFGPTALALITCLSIPILTFSQRETALQTPGDEGNSVLFIANILVDLIDSSR